MKIVKGEYQLVNEYHVGDVIVRGDSAFLIANARDDRGNKVGYQMIDLDSGETCRRTPTLLSLFEKVGNLGELDNEPDQFGEIEVHAKK